MRKARGHLGGFGRTDLVEQAGRRVARGMLCVLAASAATGMGVCGDVAYASAGVREHVAPLEFLIRSMESSVDGSVENPTENPDEGSAQNPAEELAQDSVPEVSLTCEAQDTELEENGTLYVNASLKVFVSVVGAGVDTGASTVGSFTIDELVEQGEREESDWTCLCNEDGVPVYEGTIELESGCHSVNRICSILDKDGNEVSYQLVYGDVSIESIVVDTEAPGILAYVDELPIRVIAADVGSIALFGKTTEISFQFEDISGIQSVRLEGGDASVRLHEDGLGATIVLDDQMLDSSATLVVIDRVGNETTWSLGPMGKRTTHGGCEPVKNTPLTVRPTGNPVCAEGSLAGVVADCGLPTALIRGIEAGDCSRAPVEVEVSVRDAFLGLWAIGNPDAPIVEVTKDGEKVRTVSVGYEDVALGDAEHAYTFVLPAASDHSDDGAYCIRICGQDLAGHIIPQTEVSFTVDTTPPVLDVTFEDEDKEDAHDGNTPRKLFSKGRTAHVRLDDLSLVVGDLTKTKPLVRLEAHASEGAAVDDVMVGAWEEVEPHSFECEVCFPANGTYELVVGGSDRAGNLLVGGGNTLVDDGGTYSSGSFVIDDEPPLVLVDYAPNVPDSQSLEGVDYFREHVKVNVEVRDRNPDSSRMSVISSNGEKTIPKWKVSEKDEDGMVTCTASVVYVEESTGLGSGLKSPAVEVEDLLGNASVGSMSPFVVDQTAPTVERVRLSEEPASSGQAKEERAPTLFLGGSEEGDPVLSLDLADEYALEDAWLADPAGVYALGTGVSRGDRASRVQVTLLDPVRQGLVQDAEFSDDIRLFVRDVAGNVRVWSLAEEGDVDDGRESSKANTSLDGVWPHPRALVFDATAPKVAVKGADAGAYYNEPVTVSVTVDERNLAYLLRYGPNRTMATVHRREADAMGAQTSTALCVGQLMVDGKRGSFGTYEQVLDDDGHYEVVAQLADYAQNESNEARLAEFTVDTTAPRIAIGWDNTDARNGHYYNRSRTATITVTEHNFDPSLVSIQTTGSVGPWVSVGDEHLCQVTFEQDSTESSPHRLSVGASDRAKNEAERVEEEPFVIDTQAPVVSFAKRVGEEQRFVASGPLTELCDKSAFSSAFEPHVSMSDGESLDASTVRISLVGCRMGAQAESVLSERHTNTSDRTIEVSWDNFGLSEQEGDATYELEADDIYTLQASVSDRAGNESGVASVSFSINRFGSNFYVGRVGSLDAAQIERHTQELLTEPPLVEVHEINVSGSESELHSPEADDEHLVTKEHARATQRIKLDQDGSASGYALGVSTEASDLNPCEGWTEYTYTIRPGNFGEGSDSDYGDGGQGTYVVNVSSIDRAHNNNTTMSYWDTAKGDSGEAESRNASVAFTLDERGPKLEEVLVPSGFVWGSSYEATFFVSDEYTDGDIVRAWVDGQPVALRWADTGEDLPENGAIGREGMIAFDVEAKPLFVPRSVLIQVDDYTGMEKRRASTRKEGFCLTTLAGEVGIAVAALATLATIGWAIKGRMPPRS